MKLEHSFEIDAPVDVVWATLVDVERVAPCLPGAEITEVSGDGTYKGTFTVKIGPATAAYNGVLQMQEVDEAAHTATMHAKGTDKRGQGGATATIVNRLEAAGSGTRVHAETDMTITGKLARFGRGGMMQDVSNRLLREFSECLQAKLAAEGRAAAATGAPPGAAADAAPQAGGAAAGPAGAAPPPRHEPRPIRGISLVLGVLRDRAVRLLRALRDRLARLFGRGRSR